MSTSTISTRRQRSLPVTECRERTVRLGSVNDYFILIVMKEIALVVAAVDGGDNPGFPSTNAVIAQVYGGDRWYTFPHRDPEKTPLNL